MEKIMIKISLIIPAYKRIAQTIKTIKLIQASHGLGEVFDLEIILSDSTPGISLQKAVKKEFGSQVIYTRPKKLGIATNKNQGAKIAKHPILIFCDSDMEVEPQTLLNTVKALKKHKTAGMIGGQVIWRGGANDGKHDRPRREDRCIKIMA